MAKQKYSRQRESIRENLKQRNDHPTADMVYSDIRLIFPNISLGTVYRNLSLLADNQEICKITDRDGVIHYDFDTKPHSHFICKNCGSVIDMPVTFCDTAKKMAEGFVDGSFEGRIDECSIVFSGLCKNCCGNQKAERH